MIRTVHIKTEYQLKRSYVIYTFSIETERFTVTHYKTKVNTKVNTCIGWRTPKVNSIFLYSVNPCQLSSSQYHTSPRTLRDGLP